MPAYKLTYFNGRGRGEISRMLFAAAGREFLDVRVEFPDWPALKASFPQGTMPVLEIDGKVQISQSTTIARYLTREFKLYGKNNLEATQIDQIFDTVLDAFGAKLGIVFSGKDEEKKGELLAEFMKDKVPKFLDTLEKQITEAGKGGFAVGSSLTLGDLALFVYLESLAVHEDLVKYPKLKENRTKVAELPRIAKYMEKRPVTEF